MSDLDSVELIAQFGLQSVGGDPFDFPLAHDVIEAVANSTQLKPGWHTATITFKLNNEGHPIEMSEYKISSFGETKP